MDPQVLYQRLNTILNSNLKYQVSAQNCEHIAHFLIEGRKYSPQVQAALAGSLICGFTAWKNGSKHWLSIALAGGFAGCLLINLTRKYDAVIPSPCHYNY